MYEIVDDNNDNANARRSMGILYISSPCGPDGSGEIIIKGHLYVRRKNNKNTTTTATKHTKI